MTRSTPLFQRPLPRTYFYSTLGIIAVNLLVFLVTEIYQDLHYELDLIPVPR